MMNNSLTIRNAHERLELLQDPKARIEDKLRERRAYESAFNDYICYGITRNTLKKEPESDGGYLVPETMEKRIMETLTEKNVLRQISRVMQTTMDMKIPVVASHGQAFWVPEGEALPLSDDKFARVELSAYKLGTSEVFSSEMLEESVLDINRYITETFAERIAAAEEDAFINGDGNGKPLGLLRQANVGATTEQAGVISIDDIINLVHSVAPAHRPQGVLLMNEITHTMLCRIRTADGHNLWSDDLQRLSLDCLYNQPILICGAMPDPAPGNTPIAFGDFRNFWIGDRGHHHLKRLNELRAKTDQVEFILTKRVDAKLVVPEAVKTLKIAE